MSISAPAPHGWAMAWLDTSLDGYRLARIGATTYTAAPVGDWGSASTVATAMDTALGGDGSFALDTSTGLATITSTPGGALTWPDRLGWAYGYQLGADATDATLGAGGSLSSRVVPPALVWCLSVELVEADIRAERAVERYRWARSAGYAYGSARVWRATLHMHAEAVAAYEAGLVRSGKVTLAQGGGSASALSGAVPTGRLTGYVCGSTAPRWRDRTMSWASADMLVAEAL